MALQDNNRFLLKQRITPIVNRYEYFTQDEAGQAGERVAFVEQKRFTLREEIAAWTSEDHTDVVFRLKAEKVLDIHGRYFVRDVHGEAIGYLRKAFAKSLLRSTWEVYDPADNLLMTAQETNQLVAIVRRFVGLIPLVGDVLALLPFNFTFSVGDKVIGRYNRRIGLRDHYDLIVEPETGNIDRRLLLALGIALDALQDR